MIAEPRQHRLEEAVALLREEGIKRCGEPAMSLKVKNRGACRRRLV